jgi:hypothetical protein
MLAYLGGRLSGRKQRLFAVACCRRIWPLLIYPDSREAVEAAERYAEGMAHRNELAGYNHVAQRAVQECVARFRRSIHPATNAARAAANATEERLVWASVNFEDVQLDTAHVAAVAVGEQAQQLRRRPEAGEQAGAWARLREEQRQSEILRDLIGSPFQAATLDPFWLTWNGGLIKSLAAVVYQGHAFDRLPILADALEDAGCNDPNILGHLRGPGPHVRGCWPVDLLLGKA